MRVLYIDTQGPTSERDLEYGYQLLDHLGLNNFTIAKADVTREEFREGMEEVGIVQDENSRQKIFHKLSQDVFKVTPLKQEIAESNVQCLLSGVRRGQTKERDHFKFIQYSNSQDPSKGHPILDWSDEQYLAFLSFKQVPPHPELNILLDNAIKENSDCPRVSSLRSRRPSREEGKECGIHIQEETTIPDDKKHQPVPSVPNLVIGKLKCRFCKAAKNLFFNAGIEYVEVPVHLFTHLIPVGTKTVPVVYLSNQMIGGYGSLCEHLDVKDTLNSQKSSMMQI